MVFCFQFEKYYKDGEIDLAFLSGDEQGSWLIQLCERVPDPMKESAIYCH